MRLALKGELCGGNLAYRGRYCHRDCEGDKKQKMRLLCAFMPWAIAPRSGYARGAAASK
jgi:hypothetical protein